MESTVYFKGLCTVLALAGLFILIALPLVLHKVPPNSLYGFRTPKTLRSHKIWYEANAFFGRCLIVASLVSSVAILAIYALADLSPDLYLKVSLFALIAPSGFAVILTFLHIRNFDETS